MFELSVGECTNCLMMQLFQKVALACVIDPYVVV